MRGAGADVRAGRGGAAGGGVCDVAADVVEAGADAGVAGQRGGVLPDDEVVGAAGAAGGAGDGEPHGHHGRRAERGGDDPAHRGGAHPALQAAAQHRHQHHGVAHSAAALHRPQAQGPRLRRQLHPRRPRVAPRPLDLGKSMAPGTSRLFLSTPCVDLRSVNDRTAMGSSYKIAFILNTINAHSISLLSTQNLFYMYK